MIATIKPDFAANIESEKTAVAAFLKILQEEQETLVRGEVDPLTDFAQQKTILVKQLSDYAEARNDFLRSQGLSPDRKGMEEWLKQHPSNAKILSAWKDLMELGQSVQQINQTNGVLINSRLRYNQKALSLLQSAIQSVDLYGPDGQSSHLGTGRNLGTV